MRKRVNIKMFLASLFLLTTFIITGCNILNIGGGGDGNGTPETHPLVGIWTGTWTDQAFSVSGSLNVTITQSSPSLSGTGTIGLTSLNQTWGYPVGDETGTGTGTIDANNNVTFTFNSLTVGSGSGTVTGNIISGSGTVGGLLGFGPFTFDGTISGNTINGTFTFDTGGYGIATATKQ